MPVFLSFFLGGGLGRGLWQDTAGWDMFPSYSINLEFRTELELMVEGQTKEGFQ